MAPPGTVDATYELTQVKAQFYYILDARDWSCLGDLMTTDAEFDIGDGDDRVPVLVGRDAVLYEAARRAQELIDNAWMHRVRLAAEPGQ